MSDEQTPDPTDIDETVDTPEESGEILETERLQAEID